MKRPSSLIVFSHGNSFPAGTYTQVFAELKSRGHEVVAVDKFGHDPQYPVTNNWPHLVEQLQDTAHQASLRHGDCPVWLVGHSLGGFLSLMTAARHPGLARGVVMLDSPVVSGWRANALHMAKQTQLVGAVSPGATSRKRRMHWPSKAAVIEHFRGKKAFAKWDAQVLEDYAEHGTHQDDQGERVLSFDRNIETAIYNTLPHNVESMLRKHPLRVPAAFVGGLQSLEMKQVGLDATHRIVQGRITMLDGTHLFPMERPRLTAAAIDVALMNLASLRS